VYRYIHENVVDTVRENFYVIRDIAPNVYSFMVQVLKDHQPRVIDYIKDQYENVHVLIKDNWLKLDFNHDGKISLDDLKKGVHDLYEFITNYDIIVKATEIKNNLYDEAIKFMKSDFHKQENSKNVHAITDGTSNEPKRSDSSNKKKFD